jgi:hypothetical protein
MLQHGADVESVRWIRTIGAPAFAFDRTCRAYAKIVQLDQSRTNRSSAAATAFLSPHFVFQDLTQYQE